MAVAAVVTLVDGGPTAIRRSLFDVIVVYQRNYGQSSWFHGHGMFVVNQYVQPDVRTTDRLYVGF